MLFDFFAAGIGVEERAVDCQIIRRNKLLATLPDSECQSLARLLSLVELEVGQILYRPGDRIQTIFFPLTSVLALRFLLDGQISSESLWVGLEGMVGLPIILGGQYMNHEVKVRLGGSALALSAEAMSGEFQRGGMLQRRLLRYTEVRLMQISQLSACQAWHSLEQRLARSLLMVQDFVQTDELALSSQALAETLGIDWVRLQIAAIALQDRGLIRYNTNFITILNRPGLVRSACPCYSYLKDTFARLLNG